MRMPYAVAAALLIVSHIPAAIAADGPTLTDFSGQPQSIEAFAGQGKWLVVMIWAHNCHVCNQEAEGYAQFHEARKDSDATVLGVSLDGGDYRAEAEAFIARHDLPFPNLIGDVATVTGQFAQLTGEPFRGTPSLLLYGPDGTLRAAQAGAVPIASIEAYIARQSSPSSG